MDENVLSYWEICDRRDAFYKNNERIRGGVEMGVALGDFLNGAGRREIDEMLQYLINMEHPTIQQQFFGVVLKTIEQFAEKNNYDGRNQCAVEKAKEIKRFMDESYMSCGVPLI